MPDPAEGPGGGGQQVLGVRHTQAGRGAHITQCRLQGSAHLPQHRQNADQRESRAEPVLGQRPVPPAGLQLIEAFHRTGHKPDYSTQQQGRGRVNPRAKPMCRSVGRVYVMHTGTNHRAPCRGRAAGRGVSSARSGAPGALASSCPVAARHAHLHSEAAAVRAQGLHSSETGDT